MAESGEVVCFGCSGDEYLYGAGVVTDGCDVPAYGAVLR